MLSSVDGRRVYGAAVALVGVTIGAYFLLVLAGAIAPRGGVEGTAESAGFVAAVGFLVALNGLGHVARLDEGERETLSLVGGGVLALVHTVFFVGAPLSPEPDGGRYPPLYGTLVGLAALAIAVYCHCRTEV